MIILLGRLATYCFPHLQLRAQNIKSKSTGHHHTANKWKGIELSPAEIFPIIWILFQPSILLWLSKPNLGLVKQIYLEFIKVFFIKVAIRKFLRLDEIENHLPNLFWRYLKSHCHRSWSFPLKMYLCVYWWLLIIKDHL